MRIYPYTYVMAYSQGSLENGTVTNNSREDRELFNSIADDISRYFYLKTLQSNNPSPARQQFMPQVVPFDPGINHFQPVIGRERSQSAERCALAHAGTSRHHASVGGPRRTRSMGTAPSVLVKSPLSDGNVVSTTCNCNEKLITSNDGIKLFIPKGAIKEGDSVTIAITAGFCGRFTIPSNCQIDVVSPYYWIGVSGSYQFCKPIEVEFEHYGACDPSHYQLLCCEDDDESYTMRPVDYELSFTVRDEISFCTFYTATFCSYCLFHHFNDHATNRIGAFILRPEKYQSLNHFTIEIWFSFVTSYCIKRNEESYRKKGMVLDCSYMFEASTDKCSSSYIALKYVHSGDGWYVSHSRSMEIQTKLINFYNFYTDVEELLAHEEMTLFPPRFILNVVKVSEYSTNLVTDLDITIILHSAKGIESMITHYNVHLHSTMSPISNVAIAKGDSRSEHHCSDRNPPNHTELMKYCAKVSINWKAVALQLGISEDKIDVIGVDHLHNAEAKCSAVFKIWLQTNKSPCWCRFMRALDKAGLNQAAEEVQKDALEPSVNAMASLAITEGNLNINQCMPDMSELVRYLIDIPDRDLVFFITRLLPKESAIKVITDIRRVDETKQYKIEKISEAFLREGDPSWIKVHRALIEARCSDLADIIESCFLPV